MEDLATEMVVVDSRPHDHRAKEVRKARRLNHAFRYLYRHDDDTPSSFANTIDNGQAPITSREYLMEAGGYTENQMEELQEKFPPLLELDVQRHLKPKMRFLKETILGMKEDNSSLPENIRNILPPQYYGARLERIIAPRHAFLVHYNLPHGKDLLQFQPGSASATESTTTRWQDFLKSCRNTKQFAALCNRWVKEEANTNNAHESSSIKLVTNKQIEAFDALFGRGLMAAARDELCQHNNTWPLDHINVTSAEMIDLLVQSGANPLERDNRGVSLLHWAAGTGNLGGVKALLPHFHGDDDDGVWVQAERDGATPLHWAAAGANAREFGVGGHKEVATFLLEQVTDKRRRRDLVCQLTRDGNSALMWGAWSGTLATVKFLIRNRADANVANRNGCTVAHWASSGGNVEVCQYLANTVGVDFTEPNHGGNTPLTHAVAFGRAEVVEWLRRDIVTQEHEDGVAAGLALDFVDWTDGSDEKRQQVLKLFEDLYTHERM